MSLARSAPHFPSISASRPRPHPFKRVETRIQAPLRASCFGREHAWNTVTKSWDLREAVPEFQILLELHPRPPAIRLLSCAECDEVAVQFDEAFKSHS